MPGPANWLVPDWPAPGHVRAVFTTRGTSPRDGASAAPRDFFNLGDHVGDAPGAVAANRAHLQASLGVRPVFLQQVHGTEVLEIDPATPDGATADAALMAAPGLACTIMVADCLAVLLTDAQGRAVAAAHAGWRGLAAGVLERTLERFRALVGAEYAGAATKKEAIELIAWLSPCIGPRAFEVGPEVRQAFVDHSADAVACFAPAAGGKYLANLPALARQRLAACGVHRIHGNDSGAAWCTVAQGGRYFSHRRDHARLGSSGRMAACVWLEGRAG